MKTLVLNTLGNDYTEQIKALIKDKEAEIVDTTDMKIAHCMGCNHCFLKTPGICAIKDDYAQILKKLAHSDSLWLVSDLCFRDGEMRHTLRYGALNVGVLYSGEGNQQLLDFWCYRSSANLGGHSLGAYSVNKTKEVKVCM